MTDLKSLIDAELRQRFVEARAGGMEYLDVVSGDIHKTLGFNSRMRACCHAMREMMKTGDEILHAPPSGDGSTLKVRYFL